MRCHRTAFAFIAAAGFLLTPVLATAQIDLCQSPSGDFDQDGFSDFRECNGLPLLEGLSVLNADGSPVSNVPSCSGAIQERAFCLDPATPDLFAFVVVEPGSTLPGDLLSLVTTPVSEGGLGITLHQVQGPAPNDRFVSDLSGQKGIQLTELGDLNGEFLGIANYGTPQNLDRARIYPARIADFVATACGGDECVTDRGDVGMDAVIEALTRWVGNHEVGHMFRLTADFNKRFGGYHHKSGTRVTMEQFPIYQSKRGTTTFFIPQGHSTTDQDDAELTLPSED